ncbi:hypothetical protein TIFTF001_034155 [Ficus carica]|uniref:Uncharacterized protein n=1 Tax=Ficus carica TaxID=3494 RepID=A0AA88J8H1_FICCA|nr:hypothetical protein TIFTF001_034155 [Ficus carica]
MSSGGGEISAHKISLKGLATGWIDTRQLAGQGAGNMGDDRGPRFVWPEQPRNLVGLDHELEWQRIRGPELAHVERTAGVGSWAAV